MIRRLLIDSTAMLAAALVVAVAVPIAVGCTLAARASRCVASWF